MQEDKFDIPVDEWMYSLQKNESQEEYHKKSRKLSKQKQVYYVNWHPHTDPITGEIHRPEPCEDCES